jgi:hypothetical protein
MKEGEIVMKRYLPIICAFVFFFGCDDKVDDEFLKKLDRKIYFNEALTEEDFGILEKGIKKAYKREEWEKVDKLEEFLEYAKNYMALYKVKNKVLAEELLTKEEFRILSNAIMNLIPQGDKHDEVRNLKILEDTAWRLENKINGIEEADYPKDPLDILNETGKVEGDREVYYALGGKSIIAIVDWVSADKSVYHNVYELIIYEDEHKVIDFLYLPQNRLYIHFTQNKISLDTVKVTYYFDSEQNIDQFGTDEMNTEMTVSLSQYDGPGEPPFYGPGTGWNWNLEDSSLMHITRIEIIYGKNDIYESIIIDSNDDIKILKKFFELVDKYGFK